MTSTKSRLSRLEATDNGSSRTLTIDNAVVAIRAVRVDGKPMTIAVLNQIPQVADADDSDEYVGWINRCPSRCQFLDGRALLSEAFDAENAHRHLLVKRHGEIALRAAPIRSGWIRNAEASTREARGLANDAARLRDIADNYEQWWFSPRWGWSLTAEPTSSDWRRATADDSARLAETADEKAVAQAEHERKASQARARHHAYIAWLYSLPQVYVAA